MTQMVDIVNRALSTIGTRTTVTAAELAASSTNEAIQANLIYIPYRNQLLRMAPWNCAFQTANLVYISSSPGTPENTSPFTQLWQKGQPAPPWAYEYQYPVDCLRACWITPQTATGFAGGVPITTAVTGGAPSYWQGPPVRFKVAVDQFVPVTAATVFAGGVGYAVGDIITLAAGLTTNPPIGAPVQLTVLTAPGGIVGTVAVVNQINATAGTNVVAGGSYFAQQTNPVLQGSTSGSGGGAAFNLTYGSAGDQRVILTNQEFAILNYVKEVTNENVFDDDFQEAFVHVLGVGLSQPLSGDKGLTNLALAKANAKISAARQTDGNESLTINDIVPDWIRIRGIDYTSGYSGPYSSANDGFNWGSLWAGYG
jgi:hypothetical protein